MQATWSRQPVGGELPHALSGGEVPLATPPERTLPEFRHPVAERAECTSVGRHRMLVGETAHHPGEPRTLDGDRLVPPSPQLLLDGLELRHHSVATRQPQEQEPAPQRLAAHEGEAEKREGLRFAEAAPGPGGGRMATELEQARLLRMEREREEPDDARRS